MSRRNLVCTLACVFLAAAASAGLAWHLSTGPDLTRVHELRRQAADNGLTPQEREQARNQLRQEMKNLSPEQQRLLWQETRGVFKEKLVRFFALPKEEQVTQLDGTIDRLQSARAARKLAAAAPRKKGGGQNHKVQLDWATPEERALAAQYLKRISDRCKERGLEPLRIRKIKIALS